MKRYGNKDFRQIFSDVKTVIILSFGLLVLFFVFFLGGRSGFYAAVEWAGDLENALYLIGGPPFLFLLGLVLIVLGFHEFSEYNLIRNTPTSTTRSVPVGRVEVKGTVHPLPGEDPLEAPFTGKPCVAYECRIEEYHSDDDGGDWHTIYSNRMTPPVVLRDETGEIIVDSKEAEWNIGDWEYRKELNEDDVTDRIEAFVEETVSENDFLDIDLLGGERRRFSENRIHPGQDLYVLGAARPVDEHDSLEVNTTDLVIGRDEGTGLFYLSDQSEREIVSSKGWSILFLLVTGTILTPAAAVMLCYVLGIL